MGAVVNSQGRQPLGPFRRPSPLLGEPRRGDSHPGRPCGAAGKRGGARRSAVDQGLPPLALDHRPSGALGTVATVTGVAAELGYGSCTHEPYPNTGDSQLCMMISWNRRSGWRRSRSGSRNKPICAARSCQPTMLRFTCWSTKPAGPGLGRSTTRRPFVRSWGGPSPMGL